MQSWGSLVVTLHVHLQQQTHPQPCRQEAGISRDLYPRSQPYLLRLLVGTHFGCFLIIPKAMTPLSRVGSSFTLWKLTALKMSRAFPKLQNYFSPLWRGNISCPVLVCLSTQTDLLYTITDMCWLYTTTSEKIYTKNLESAAQAREPCADSPPRPCPRSHPHLLPHCPSYLVDHWAPRVPLHKGLLCLPFGFIPSCHRIWPHSSYISPDSLRH